MRNSEKREEKRRQWAEDWTRNRNGGKHRAKRSESSLTGPHGTGWSSSERRWPSSSSLRISMVETETILQLSSREYSSAGSLSRCSLRTRADRCQCRGATRGAVMPDGVRRVHADGRRQYGRKPASRVGLRDRTKPGRSSSSSWRLRVPLGQGGARTRRWIDDLTPSITPRPTTDDDCATMSQPKPVRCSYLGFISLQIERLPKLHRDGASHSKLVGISSDDLHFEALHKMVKGWRNGR